MQFTSIKKSLVLTAITLLTACANPSTNQQLGGALIKAVEQTIRTGQGGNPPNGNASTSADYRRGFRPIHDTELANLFADKPFYLSGGKKALFPRVAITVDDALMDQFKMPTAQQCYFMHARVWESEKSFRDIRPFSVCGKDIQQPPGGFVRADSTLNIWNSGIATAGLDHTGNVRTEGPTFPMRALPSGPMDAVPLSPTDLSYYFVHGTLTAMKFDWTQPDPRVWFVKFGKLDESGFKALQERSRAATALAASTGASVSQSSAPPTEKPPVTKPASGPVLSYSSMFKQDEDVSRSRKRLIGRQIELTLKSEGPHLFVDRKDETFFICQQRAPSFKGGKVKAMIIDFEFNHEVQLLVTLDRCQ